jgi:hypothetical protein
VSQKMWVRTYLASEDPIFAAQSAYPDVALHNVRAFSYKVIKQKKIREALDRYFLKRGKYDAALNRNQKNH